jgi:hypothetical protein
LVLRGLCVEILFGAAAAGFAVSFLDSSRQIDRAVFPPSVLDDVDLYPTICRRPYFAVSFFLNLS